MKLAQFLRLLNTFGANLDRWPPADRAAGQSLRDHDAAARASWDEAARLDALFALDRVVPADPATENAIVQNALRHIRTAQRPASDWSWLWSRPMGVTFATTAAAGLVMGFALGPMLQPHPARDVPAIAFLLGEVGLGAQELL